MKKNDPNKKNKSRCTQPTKKNSCCQRKQINKQVNKDSATFVPAAHIKSDHCVQKPNK